MPETMTTTRCLIRADLGVDGRRAKHVPQYDNGAMVNTDGDPLRATCVFCGVPIARTHRKSTWWLAAIPTGQPEATLQEWARRRVAEDAIPEPNTGCLLWTSGDGYARASYRGESHMVTRALLGLPRLPRNHMSRASLYALHHCDTPACVNEAHLFVGTARDNARDALSKGRFPEARKTHCPHGHPLSGDNLYVPPGQPGKRRCRTCDKARSARRTANTLLPGKSAVRDG